MTVPSNLQNTQGKPNKVTFQVAHHLLMSSILYQVNLWVILSHLPAVIKSFPDLIEGTWQSHLAYKSSPIDLPFLPPRSPMKAT